MHVRSQATTVTFYWYFPPLSSLSYSICSPHKTLAPGWVEKETHLKQVTAQNYFQQIKPDSLKDLLL